MTRQVRGGWLTTQRNGTRNDAICAGPGAAVRSPPMFLHVFIAALAAGVLATVAAGSALALSPAWIPRLVSFAVGALLGAVFI